MRRQYRGHHGRCAWSFRVVGGGGCPRHAVGESSSRRAAPARCGRPGLAGRRRARCRDGASAGTTTSAGTAGAFALGDVNAGDARHLACLRGDHPVQPGTAGRAGHDHVRQLLTQVPQVTQPRLQPLPRLHQLLRPFPYSLGLITGPAQHRHLSLTYRIGWWNVTPRRDPGTSQHTRTRQAVR